MTADALRQRFLDFFKSKKHKIVESDSLVPADDPTVLFTPAGMNQFKRQFMGFVTDFNRAASSQRCLRTDDLDKVGKTSGHHTFFEMLGNFSFGDYFKSEAIRWAWQFLTEELKIDKDRLWISVYKDDEEAYGVWHDVAGIPEEKIVRLGDKENFWPSEAKQKGPNGPCGPCSEIFFDYGKEQGCKRPGCNPGCGCGRFVEIWNLVFTQFNRKDSGLLEPLPKKNIDTGMGLERLTAVMQGKNNNFETELFTPLTDHICSQIKDIAQKSNKELVCAVSDHIRAITFAIYDGVLPSNEGRGYVVRKLIRKSTLHLKTLGIKPPFLYKLVAVVSDIMKLPYPDLIKRREDIAEIVLSEEKNFCATLSSSDRLLKDKFSGFSNKQNPQSAGTVAFELYDTYGMPLEITLEWLKKHKIEISIEAFNRALEEQKNRSKLQSAMKGDVFASKDFGLGVKDTRFLGYEKSQAKAKIILIIQNGVQVKKITAGQEAQVILDKSVFYAESGGQIGDAGALTKGKNVFEVSDTKKSGGLIIHLGKAKTGVFRVADEVNAAVDTIRRSNIARNHTATHLLQAALRSVLGAHVQQQGSLVGDDKFRFDFTHFKDVSEEELGRIEEQVNTLIINNTPVLTKGMPLNQAKKTGALAFFGEKYETKVRVVYIGDISKELCGGTHVDSIGSIGLFKIIHEGSVASGVRRIEAVTGSSAYDVVKKNEEIVRDVSLALNTTGEKIYPELQKRLTYLKELEKKLAAVENISAKNSTELIIQQAVHMPNGIMFVTDYSDDENIGTLRTKIDLIRSQITSAVIALGTSSNLVIGVTQDLYEKIDAVKLFNEIAVEVNGRGGGRRDFAQGGIKNPGNFDKAFQKLKDIVGSL